MGRHRGSRFGALVGAACALAAIGATSAVASDEVSIQAATDDLASVVPVAVADASGTVGDSSPPALRTTADGFTSTGTAQTVRLTDAIADGLTIETPSGRLRLVPLAVSDSVSDGRLVNDSSVVYANTADGADTAVRPVEGGLETFTNIRDAQAPEDYRFRFELPAGLRLVRLSTGAVAVVATTPERAQADDSAPTDASELPDDWAAELPGEPIGSDVAAEQPGQQAEGGTVVAEIQPAFALDVRGQRIPTSMSVDGDVLTLTVSHRSKGVQYPVVADPDVQVGASAVGGTASTSLPTWRSLYDWAAGYGYFGWRNGATASGPDAYNFTTGLPGADGLWVWPAGGRTYSPGVAGWTYPAPGTTRVLKADVELTYPPRLLSHHCVAVALAATDGARNVTRFCKPPQPPKANPATVTLSLADPAPADPRATSVAVRVELPCEKADPSACQKSIPSAEAAKDGLRVKRVDMTLVDDDLPALAPSGEWYDLRDRYVNGQSQHGLTLAGSDDGAGVQRAAVEEVGRGEVFAASAPCDATHRTAELDNRVCPQSYSTQTSIDATQLGEGRHVFRETATDLAGNAGASDPWAVTVDRTGPTGGGEFDAALDPDAYESTVTWNPAADPALADGTAGSGVDLYRYRYQRGGGDWSDWQTSEVPWFTLTDSYDGEMIGVQAQAVDAVGNAGEVYSDTVTAQEPNVTEDNLGEAPEGDQGGPLDSEPADLGDEGSATLRTALVASADSDAFAPMAVQAADTYRETLCHDGAPCGRYSASNAVKYALAWYSKGRGETNYNYNFYGGNGGDCTNFVSQAVKAGGMRFMRAEGYNSPNGNDKHFENFHKGQGSWWSYFVDIPQYGTRFTVRHYEPTESFVRSERLYTHLTEYALGSYIGRGAKVHAGDLVFYNLHGTDLDGLDHTQIVTRVTRGQIWVAQHSPGYNQRLSSVIKRNQTADHRLHQDWEYWIVRPKYTAANIP